MIEILFGLFVWNSNGELRKTSTIPSTPQNNRIATNSLFWNSEFAFNCTIIILILKTATIPLFSYHPNIGAYSLFFIYMHPNRNSFINYFSIVTYLVRKRFNYKSLKLIMMITFFSIAEYQFLGFTIEPSPFHQNLRLEEI
jgi:hypothetical protein